MPTPPKNRKGLLSKEEELERNAEQKALEERGQALQGKIGLFAKGAKPKASPPPEEEPETMTVEDEDPGVFGKVHNDAQGGRKERDALAARNEEQRRKAEETKAKTNQANARKSEKQKEVKPTTQALTQNVAGFSAGVSAIKDKVTGNKTAEDYREQDYEQQKLVDLKNMREKILKIKGEMEKFKLEIDKTTEHNYSLENFQKDADHLLDLMKKNKDNLPKSDLRALQELATQMTEFVDSKKALKGIMMSAKSLGEQGKKSLDETHQKFSGLNKELQSGLAKKIIGKVSESILGSKNPQEELIFELKTQQKALNKNEKNQSPLEKLMEFDVKKLYQKLDDGLGFKSKLVHKFNDKIGSKIGITKKSPIREEQLDFLQSSLNYAKDHLSSPLDRQVFLKDILEGLQKELKGEKNAAPTSRLETLVDILLKSEPIAKAIEKPTKPKEAEIQQGRIEQMQVLAKAHLDARHQSKPGPDIKK